MIGRNINGFRNLVMLQGTKKKSELDIGGKKPKFDQIL